MTNFEIKFTESNQTFRPACNPDDIKWIESSFGVRDEAVGELRFNPPGNGCYQSKHPVLSASGETVGYISRGVYEIGYTYTSIYAGGCFWIANAPIRGTSSENNSRVSLVGEVGRFFWGKDPKYGHLKSFGFGSSWVNSVKAYKLIDNDQYLFYLTSYGFAMFDVYRREMESKVEFEELSYQFSGFAISPKVLTLAIAFSKRAQQDPVDGDYRYFNLIRLYDLKTGKVIGEHMLSGNNQENWDVQFSEKGRQLQVKSNDRTLVYDMNAS